MTRKKQNKKTRVNSLIKMEKHIIKQNCNIYIILVPPDKPMVPMSTDIENELITLLMHDDESAFQSIYDRYSERVYNFSFLLLKDTGWSEDIVQEVFVKLWNSRNNLDPKGKMWTYLYVLTRRASLNKLRDIKNSDACFDRVWENISQLADCSHEKLVVKELSAKLDEVLQELPTRQREVFTLSRFEGFTHQEIAEKLKISPNTVKNHMIQALKVIRKRTFDIDVMLLLFLLSA